MHCTHREIAMLELRDDDNACAWGECAPLTGVHRESIADAIEGLRFWSALCASMMPLGIPSADYAISTAELQRRNMLQPAAAHIRIATFVHASVAEVERLSEARAFDGVASVKMKIGRLGVREERRVLDALLCALDDGARVRLDGNRKMSLDACVELMQGIEPSRVEYLEDPIASPFELTTLASCTGMRIALDETLLEWMRGEGVPDALAFAPCVTAHVVRLSCVGRIELALRHAKLTRNHGVHAICSTAYESNFSLRVAAIVASQMDPANVVAHGLGTSEMYAHDFVAPLVVARGVMEVQPLPVLDRTSIGADE